MFCLRIKLQSLQPLHCRQLSATKRRIIFMGTPACAARSLETLHAFTQADNSYEIVACVTQPPSLSGRSKKLQPSAVNNLATNLHIPFLIPSTAKDEEFIQQIMALEPDICITAAYGNFLPSRFLKIPKHGTFNIHPSLLPKYRGAAPIQRCLENGDDSTGVTILKTVLKMDAGPIVRQLIRKLDGNENSTSLLDELFIKGTHELIAVLPAIFDCKISLSSQNELSASIAPKISAVESVVDFSCMSARVIHNKCRALHGWPGILSTFAKMDASGNLWEHHNLKIISTCVIEDNENDSLGSSVRSTTSDSGTSHPHECSLIKHQVASSSSNSSGKDKDKDKEQVLRVVCADGSVLGLCEVQPVNGKVMTARAYVNGLRGHKLAWVSSSSSTSSTQKLDVE